MLRNALLHHCPELKEIGEVSRPGLVHRLDKNTSGLLVVAKTSLAHQALVRQFPARETGKQYQALVWGRLRRRKGSDRKGRRPPPHPAPVDERPPPPGKAAVTLWRCYRNYPGPLTLVDTRTETGRTHQLRVHLASEGHPALGDATYGGGVSRLAGRPKLTGN